jgi:hypothetical protein
MNSLKKGLAMSAVISALAAGALTAHADTGVTLPGSAESRQYESLEPQVDMGSMASYTTHEGSAVAARAQTESSPIGTFHKADASPVRNFSSTLRAGPKRPIPSVFDNPINIASPG